MPVRKRCDNDSDEKDKVQIKRPRVEPEEKRRYQCTKCDKSFAHRGSLFKHVKAAHSGRVFKCKECSDVYQTAQLLRRHVCKKFACDQCDARFVWKSELNKHLKTHSPDKKRYSCIDCEKTFADPGGLLLHRNTKHLGRTYKCGQCGLELSTPRYLKNHILAKHTEKKFKCDTCGSKFGRQFELKLHSRIHSKKYKCEQCGRGYGIKQSLDTHILDTHSEKKFVCDQCGHKFSRM